MTTTTTAATAAWDMCRRPSSPRGVACSQAAPRNQIHQLRFNPWTLDPSATNVGGSAPPRKPNDTSMGDAINWEWIVECAKTLNGSVIIVSRDRDYGVTYNKI